MTLPTTGKYINNKEKENSMKKVEYKTGTTAKFSIKYDQLAPCYSELYKKYKQPGKYPIFREYKKELYFSPCKYFNGKIKTIYLIAARKREKDCLVTIHFFKKMNNKTKGTK